MADEELVSGPVSDPNTGSDLSSIIGLLGGALSTYGSIKQNSDYNNAIRAAQKREQELYNQMLHTTPPEQAKGIMQLKTAMTAEMRNQIIQEISAEMAAKGLGASTGIVQEAIASALVKAEVQMFQLASQNYYQGIRLPMEAQPRTLPAPPQPAANPFGAIAKIASSKEMWNRLLKPQPEAPNSTPPSDVPPGMDSSSPGTSTGVQGFNDLPGESAGIPQASIPDFTEGVL